MALCKSEETLRKFLQDRAYQEGEEGEVHFVFFEDFFLKIFLKRAKKVKILFLNK